ncbi:hypothetical protein OIO90_003359 [Microbotryomycetes sp. JL221]|nr:hypothetical protein OIO90_003359 [Microbotryomycetes sp. JL221]
MADKPTTASRLLKQSMSQPATPPGSPGSLATQPAPKASGSSGSRTMQRIPSADDNQTYNSPRRRMTLDKIETSPSKTRPTASTSNSAAPLNLTKLEPGVVQSRTGSVLSRGFIIKSDSRPVAPPSASETEGLAFATTSKYDNGSTPSPIDQDASASCLSGLHLTGATNFRGADMNIYGVAQPTETGLRTVLSLLRSQNYTGPHGKQIKGRQTVWFCTREEPVVYLGSQPFVLREAAHPTRTYSISDRAENLEGIENRLKQDILREAARYGGVILVQEEIRPEHIVSSWIAVDSVRTVREVWEQVAADGYNVIYHRTPVTRDQSPEDRYLDTYTYLLAKIPTSSSLVFNCGIGIVRTTFAMSAALIVRRRQVMLECGQDPLDIVSSGTKTPSSGEEDAQVNQGAVRVLQARKEQVTRDRSLLRLMSVLQKSLGSSGNGMILSLLLSQPQLLENLRAALTGKYDLVLSLLSTLDDGTLQKQVVDTILDHCDHLVNLRESVLQHRVRYASLAKLDAASSEDHRSRAIGALERYFFLVAFSAFVSDSDKTFSTSFSSWLGGRSEIGRMIARMRKEGKGHFYVFAPVQDLSAIAKGEAGQWDINGLSSSLTRRTRLAGGEIIGDEWARQIVRNRQGIILRSGMILKNDQWTASAEGQDERVRGAINFRRVEGSYLYGLSQPTQDGIERVLDIVGKEKPSGSRTVWINLREEPLIYINGTPYVLRQESVSLRNVKSYAGISSSRLELLEDRLKSDVLAELKAFDGRLLLHSEDEDGSVNPVWETVGSEDNVKTVREIFDETASKSMIDAFGYYRIPITAEKSPDFSDVRDLVEIVAQLDVDNSAVIVNCQLGRGRSTRAQVIIALVQRWLKSEGCGLLSSSSRSSRYSYTVINNLLRTIRSGQEVKNAVDEAITACGHTFDLLDAIEESRQAAEDAGENQELKHSHIAHGLHNLRAYYFLILFSSFLNESKAETWRDLSDTYSYESYVKDRPVFKTIERELDNAGIDALVPLEKPILAGNALTDEIADFVSKRSGRILSPYTLLKSDFFSGLQKMSLPERVDGAPNFRRVRLIFQNDGQSAMVSHDVQGSPLVFGTGMPTIDGLRRALEKMGAHQRQITWTSMREEPVIYVSGGRPHVLRLFDAPLENVVTTGVTAETVEAMESALKEDLLAEARNNNGKILLHDEIVEPDGSFTVTAVWEDVSPEDILTPREVFARMREEGIKVDYERLPVTDEQAPIPGVYSRIEQRVSQAVSSGQDEIGLVFNCQMGRGRTTTGMVAAMLVSNILFERSTAYDLAASMHESSMHESTTLSWDSRDSDPYLAGEYKIVLQLVGVLPHGKTAKKLVDRAIDNCEGVQNLRKAIYDFKLRAEAADEQSPKHKKIFHVACNYLYRYASLIVFANYLLEKSAGQNLSRSRRLSDVSDTDTDEEPERHQPHGSSQTLSKPFKEWLQDRREISHILARKTLE